MTHDDHDDEEDVMDALDEIRDKLDDSPDLESTHPREAFDLWLRQNDDKADETLGSYRYRVKPFLEFLDQQDITDLSELDTRDIKRFEVQRRETADLQKQTLNNQFGTLRLFLDYAHDLNAVSKEVVNAVDVPDLTKEDRVNTEKLVADRALDILAGLERYQYASRDHVLFLLMWRTTIRLGTLHALDVGDVYVDEDDRRRLRESLEAEGFSQEVVDGILDGVQLPLIWPRHREETSLKNQEQGERVINLSESVGEVVREYIDVNRPAVTDEHGRQPLLASKKGSGRLSKPAMRNTVYVLTQPCQFGGECPHDKDPDTCEYREHGQGSRCPSSRSPHKIRTGSITHHRNRGWPVSELSDRANTSEELVEGVYDQPETLVRGMSRRGHLDKLEGEE
jgi:site-specific recombinase XerD